MCFHDGSTKFGYFMMNACWSHKHETNRKPKECHVAQRQLVDLSTIREKSIIEKKPNLYSLFADLLLYRTNTCKNVIQL